jgi:hypothetical protein
MNAFYDYSIFTEIIVVYLGYSSLAHVHHVPGIWTIAAKCLDSLCHPAHLGGPGMVPT